MVVTLFENIINDVIFLIGLTLEDKLLDSLESQLFRVELHFSIALVFIQFDFVKELLREGGREDHEAHCFGVGETGTHDLIEVGPLDFIEEESISLIHGHHLQSAEVYHPSRLLQQGVDQGLRGGHQNMSFINTFARLKGLTLTGNTRQLA